VPANIKLQRSQSRTQDGSRDARPNKFGLGNLNPKQESQVEELAEKPKSGKWVKWRTLILRTWAVDPELCPRCHKEMKRAKALIQQHELNRLLKNLGIGLYPSDPARRHHPPSVRSWKNRSSPTVNARSRPTGTIGKQPDQASAQPGYWLWAPLTAKFLNQHKLTAGNQPLLTHQRRILGPK